MKLKFYVLTSRDFKALLRHNSPEYSNIPKEDTVIVINSLSKAYEEKVKATARKKRLNTTSLKATAHRLKARTQYLIFS